MISVALFAKPPIPGRTKSRLAMTIGDDAAAAFAQAALIDNLKTLSGADVVASVWHPPDSDPAEFGGLVPPQIAVRSQVGVDLGERMAHALDSALADGAPAALVIGADCVTHQASTFVEAATLLREHDAALQPAHDGGFTMIGCCRPIGSLLENLTWGGETALTQVKQRLQEAAWRVALTAPSLDVDVATDLSWTRAWVVEHRPDGAVARWFAGFGQ